MPRLNAVVCAVALCIAGTLAAQNYSISHVAGTTGGSGYQDGLGSAARFTLPTSVAVDRNGNVYVGEEYALRRVSATGNVTTFAGKFRSAGVTNGSGGAARVSDVIGIAIDSAGNIFIAEAGVTSPACVIRKITGGLILDFAGVAGACTTTDGVGNAARFYFPRGLAIDSADNLYVTQADHVIRKITPGGTVSTLAGLAGNSGSADGTGPAARFNSPTGIAVDSAGNVFVNDTYNFTVRRITPGGVVTTFAGTAGSGGSSDGTGASARFNYPWGLTIDPTDTLYDADYYGTIRRITPTAVVTTVAGSSTLGYLDGNGTAARFGYANFGIGTDKGGNLYVADYSNGAVRKISATFDVSTLAGLPVQKDYLDGIGSAARFKYPRDVAVDGSGNAYLTDADSNAVRKITAAGVVTTFAGGSGAGGLDGTGSGAQFNNPIGIAIDSSGNLYVADGNGRTIRKITPGAVVTTLAGSYGLSGHVDATGSSARFNFPHSLTVDAAGNVYVTEFYDQNVRKITAAGVVTTLAGSPGASGFTDGTGAAARFNNPRGITVGTGGNLYLADYSNHTIRQITPAGVVSTYAGSPGISGNVDGTGLIARFSYPLALTADGGGNLFVTTGGNNLIRKVAPGGVVTTVGPGANNFQSIDGTTTDARVLGIDGIAALPPPSADLYVSGRDDAALRIMRPTITDVGTFNPPGPLVGSAVNLDATAGTATSWSWTLLRRPTGSAATLSSTSIRNPTFTPDLQDLYTFQLRADGPNGTRYSTVEFTPVGLCSSQLGPTVTVALSGSSSFCASSSGGTASVTGTTGGEELTYRWGYRTTSGVGAITDIPGANFPNYVVRGPDLGGGTGTRYVVLTVVPGCGSNRISNELPVTLLTAPVSTITSPATVQGLSSGNAASIPDAGPGATYSWTITGGTITGSASTRSITFSARNSSPITLSVTAIASGCTSSSSRIIAVNELPYTFQHLAGTTGGTGAIDGSGTAARFDAINGIAVDRDGSMYVADGSAIRKFMTSGRVSTLAGMSDSPCQNVNATGSAARFCFTGGIAVDAAGNVYVMDNVRLRKITPAGVVTFVAGSGGYGGADGTGSAAQFETNGPLAADSAGNIFVLDSNGQTVRKVTPAGVVTTFAGAFGAVGYVDDTGANARFNNPQGMTIDSSDNLLVADSYNHVIRRITPAGVVTTVAGAAGDGRIVDGPLSSARLYYPWRVAVDAAGNIYTAEYYYAIRSISATGFVSTIAGSKINESGFVDGTGAAARFNTPTAMAIEPGGSVVLSDGAATIRRVTAAGVVTTIAGAPAMPGSTDGTGAAALFNNPFGVAFAANGSLYVTDSSNFTVRNVTAAGVVTTIAGSPRQFGAVDANGSNARFGVLGGAAVDGSGNVYVADQSYHTIRRITPAGDVSTIAGVAGSSGSADGTGSAARFYSPSAIVADGFGSFLITDRYNHTIRRMTPAGVVTTVAGTAGSIGSADGTGSAARFYYPTGLAVDASGNLYIADTYNYEIRKMTPAGVVTTVVTQAMSGMYYPTAVAVDAGGDLFFAGAYDGRVMKLAAITGALTTLGGVPNWGASIDGTGTIARVGYMNSIVEDGNGGLYFADGSSQAIRVARPTPLPDVASGPSSIAAGTIALLDTAPQTATTWTWSILRRPAGSATSFSNPAARNPTFTPDMPDLYVLMVRAENVAGVRYSTVNLTTTGSCSPTLTGATATLTGAATFCASASGGIASVAVTGGADVAYRWGWRSSSGNPLITVIPGANSSSYAIKGSDLGGSGTKYLVVTVTPSCGSKLISNEIILSVSAAPDATITAPASVSGFSTGNTASVPNAGASASYSWNITNGTITGGVGTRTITFTAGNSNPITLGITVTAGGCPTTSSTTVTVVPAPYTFEHFAGTTGGNGRWDGSGSVARFTAGRSLAIDANGNLYVPDNNNDVLRVISHDGAARTLAGLSGVCGSVDGTGAGARLCFPDVVAIDASGNVFFTQSAVIRKVTLAGVVSTIAGTAFATGSADGTGSAARFSYDMWGIAIDAGGNVYVSDSGNNTIRKITPGGVVTTLAGTAGSSGSVDGTGPAARFNFPMDLTIDAGGTLYLSDRNNDIIRTVSPLGVVTTIAGVAGAGGYADGPATTTARFNYPEGIAVDGAGAVYVADSYNARIRKIVSGVVSTLAGGAIDPTVDGVGTAARFAYPIGLTRDRNGDLYVLDNGYAVRKVTPAGAVTTVVGEVIRSGSADGTGLAALFAGPAGVALDGSGNVWMTDYPNHVVRRITPAGVTTTIAGYPGLAGATDGTGAAARFAYPDGIALDAAGNAYISTGAQTIRKVTPAGVVTTLAGSHFVAGSADGAGSAARFNYPRSMAVDAVGNIYVADSANHTIRRITPAGVVTTLAGSAGFAGLVDGTGSAARFNRPIGLVIDNSGNILVGDFNNARIRQVTPAGVVTTVIATDDSGYPIGTIRADGLAMDSSNNLYATDSSTNMIRKLNPARVVTTIGGSLVNGYSVGASTDGSGTMARFNNNSSITVDPTGETLYVGEYSNASIRFGKLTHLIDVATTATPSVGTGTLVQLDTTPQTATSWTWSIVRRPAGSAATLSSTSVRNPTFTPDAPDVYTFLVRAVGGGTVRYSTVDVTATGSCTPPLSGAVASITGASTFCASSVGGTASVTVTGGGFTAFRWGWRSTSGGAITDIAGATGSSYSVRGSDLGGTGSRFLVVTVTPSCGSALVSNETPLTVTAAPDVTITAPPIVFAKSAGLVASVPNAGAGATYSWTISEGVITSGASTRQIVFSAGNESPITLSVSVTTGGSCTNTGSTTVNVSTLPYTFKVFAGTTGGAGFYDGLPAAARLRLPIAIAIDRDGNSYVSDSDNMIRKISASGVVSTLAGLAGSGCALVDGTGPAARFCFANGLAVDNAGNVYVADTYQHAIRKITRDGVVTTLAGNGSQGYVDGTGAATRFRYPYGITYDPLSGNLFVTDEANCRIRQVTTAGVVTTVAGGPCGYADGTGSAARFNGPVSITNDGAGNVYVSDYFNNRIRKIAPGAVVTTLAGSTYGYADGTGAAAQFRSPAGVAVDRSGNVIVADAGNQLVRRVTPAGVVTTAAGGATVVGTANGPAASARFNDPWGVAVDASDAILLAEDYNHDVRRIASGIVSTYAGAAQVFGSADGTGTAATLNAPFGVAADSSGNVYVSDTFNNIIRKITPAGIVSTLAGTANTTGGSADGTGPAASFFNPRGITVDSSGTVYVADWKNDTIRKITPAGVVTTLAGIAGVAGFADGGPGVATFDQPVGITVDGAGFVYVTDFNNATIRKITPAGIVSTLAGSPGLAGSADGIGSAARFNGPHGIAVDGAGNLYVCDAYNNRIRKITPAGSVTTVTGQIAGWLDGPSTSAQLYVPTGVAVDGSGNLYVADRFNHRIRKVTPDGTVITIAGRNENDNSDGTGDIAMVGDPSEIAVDSNGLIYVADFTFHNIRVGVITPLADAAIVDNSSIGVGTAVNFDASPQTPGTTYTWSMIRKPAGSGAQLSSTSVRNPTFTPDFADVYTFLLRADNGGNTRYSTVDVTATGACTSLSLTATASVAGATSVCAVGTGGTASVSTTGGAGLSYRWGYRDVSGGTTTDIPLANNPTYLVSGSDFGGTGTKFLVVTVTPTCGSPVTSNETTITVRPQLSSVAINATGSTTVSPTGTGGTVNLTYSGGDTVTQQWGYRTVSGGTITNIPGQTTTAYIIHGADFPAAGIYYLVARATPGCGNITTSNEITLTVGSTIPTNVVAAPNADGTSVHITWAAAVGAVSYDVLRSTDGTIFTARTTATTALTFDDATSPDTAYLYRIHVTGGGDSANTYAGTFVFTDSPVTNTTLIKAIHFTQLEAAANAMLTLAGQPTVTFSGPPAANTVTVQRIHLVEIRDAINQARTALGVGLVTFDEPVITGGTTTIKVLQIEELRQGAR